MVSKAKTGCPLTDASMLRDLAVLMHKPERAAALNGLLAAITYPAPAGGKNDEGAWLHATINHLHARGSALYHTNFITKTYQHLTIMTKLYQIFTIKKFKQFKYLEF